MLFTLGDIPGQAAASFGDKHAMVFHDRTLTFNEIDCLSNQLASSLMLLGIEAGDRVALYSENCWEWVVSYYGILKAGAVVNPINSMCTAEEVRYITCDCQAKAIISSLNKGRALLSRQGASDASSTILFGDERIPGALRFSDVLSQGDKAFSMPPTDPASLATIAYTSGTTGWPKGAALSHRNILMSTAMTATMHTRTELDSVVSALPCTHVYGNVVMNSALWFGMTLVLLRKFNEEEVLEAIQQHRCTMFEGVPTMYMSLLNYARRTCYDTSSLRKCTVGGQTMPIATMQAFEEEFNCPLIELWGMTELAGPATTHPFYGDARHGSIGLPLPGVDCRIAGIDDSSVSLPAGEDGELMVRGPIVMQGYHGKEEQTRNTIDADGWLHTGDIARMDSDGYIYVVDRKKDMFVTAGFNIYPAELERVLAGHPAVSIAAVGPKPDSTKGEVAKAYIVLRRGFCATEKEITDYCRDHLAAYKVPRAVQFVEELPKTSSGKVMRRELYRLDNE